MMNNWFGRGQWPICGQYYGSGGMIVIGILVLLVLGVLLYLAFSKNRGVQDFRSHSSPQDILKTRYAKGEISREEYQQALEDLS